MNKLFAIFIFLSLFVSSCRTTSFGKKEISEKLPPNGCIPDEKSAILIAEIIWQPIFADYLDKKKPFIAKLKNDSIWVVTGSLPPVGYKGGCGSYIEMSKKTARVYKIDEYR